MPVQQDTPTFVKSAPRRHKPVSMPTTRRLILDPFLAYAEGEELLRSQLNALSRDHLQNMVEGYGFAGVHERDWARQAPADALVERIVERVRARYESPIAPGRESEREGGQQTSTADSRID